MVQIEGFLQSFIFNEVVLWAAYRLYDGRIRNYWRELLLFLRLLVLVHHELAVRLIIFRLDFILEALLNIRLVSSLLVSEKLMRLCFEDL